MFDETQGSFHSLIDQLQLEHKLAESFTFSSFPKYLWPDFSYGLPRCLDEYSDQYLRVKKDFEDLNVLKEKLAIKYLSQIYTQFRLKKSHKITLVTYVVPGGLGDFYFQKFFQECLEKHLPLVKTQSISFIHISAPPILSDRKNHVIHRFSSKEELAPSFLPNEILSSIKSASLLIQIPTPFPFWEDLLNHTDYKGKTLTIGEYGFIQNEDYSPKKETFSLGLHFLEYGILLKNPKKSIDSDLKNDFLKSLTSKPYYFCYFFTKDAATTYLLGLTHALCEEHQPVVILTPDIGLFFEALELHQDKLKNHHISTISLFYKKSKGVINCSHDGKELTIFHTGPISHEDFLYLTKHSNDPVGIRGNLSISEALSFKKAFFYDPLKHNMPFYYELLSLAKTISPSLEAFFKVFKKSNLSQDYLDFSKSIKNKNFKTDFDRFSIKIEREMGHQEFLIGLIGRSLFHFDHPILEKKERELIALFCNQVIDFEDLISKTRALISSYSIVQQNPN